MAESSESLRLEVSQLREDLEVAQDNAHRAAEFGKTLLASNETLSDKLEKREKEFAQQLEQLEQENYSLKMKLECQQSSASSVQQELETELAMLEKEQATREKRMDEVHSKKLLEVTNYNNDLKTEIEKLNVQMKTFQERVKKQEEIIEQLKEEAGSRGNSSMLHNELLDLEQLYAAEKSRSEDLELQMLEVSGQLEVAVMEVGSLQQKIVGLEEECEERNKMAKEWYDALQVSKDQNAELCSQLELLKTREDCVDHSKNGNSLFGEVDDRRMNVEKKMIGLKVKYESLERTYATTKQQLRKMKAEVSALLCQCSAATADATQVQRLQRALNQSKEEVQTLSAKLHQLEQQQAEGVALQEVKKYMSAFVDYGEKAEYIRFLEQELEEQKKSHGAVIKELDLKRTQMIWETNKLCEAEAKLHQSEREQAKLRKQQTKLHARNQETLEELERVRNTCKQHEAEKQYLEEELKQKNKGKQQPLTKQSTSTSHSESTATSTSHAHHSESTAGHAHHSETTTSTGSRTSGPAVTRTRRDINILEDLNKELFSSEGFLDQKVVQQCQVDSDVENRSVMANLEEVRSKKRTQVVCKDSVNKCPQQ